MELFTSSTGRHRDGIFAPYDEFTTDCLPSPGKFLNGHDVLVGDDHILFHRLTRELFEERGVYDMTFNYNLARLNIDTRHPEAGYRYAEERPEGADAIDMKNIEHVLWAEFTPTTPFCPQTDTLTVGSFRAWNGLSDRHEYDLVRVRTGSMHYQSETINERLAKLEEEYLDMGTVATDPSQIERDRSQ